MSLQPLQLIFFDVGGRYNGPLATYAKNAGVHAPGMPGTFSPSPQVSDPNMHHGLCVTHMPWCMTGSLTSDFLWNRWRGKRSRHSRRIRNLQFYLSGKRPMAKVSLLYSGPFLSLYFLMTVGMLWRLLLITCHDDVIKWIHFHVGGPLCGEFTGPRYIPPTKPETRSFDMPFDLGLNKRWSKLSWGWWFETPSRSLWCHFNA